MDEKELYRGEMDPPRILKLLEHYEAPHNIYAIGGEPLSTSTWHLSQVILGPECRSLAEIEQLVARIRADLDAILVAARVRLIASQA